MIRVSRSLQNTRYCAASIMKETSYTSFDPNIGLGKKKAYSRKLMQCQLDTKVFTLVSV